MKAKQSIEKHCYTARFITMLSVLGLCAGVLVWRVVDLAVVDQAFLKHQGDARSIRTVQLQANRGMITDRHGAPLAVSTPVQSIWLNPQDFDPNASNIDKMATLLNTDAAQILQKVKNAQQKEFIYLKRQANPDLASKIKKLNIPGIHFTKEFKRFYPEGEVTAHLIGLTNVDDEGQEGLELAYNGWLQGIPGKKIVMKDRLGHIIAELKNMRDPKPGHDLTLSIDRRIQYVVYRELKKTVDASAAKSGSVVVLDTRTGEVLAMVNLPSYNPNIRPKYSDGRYRNRAVTDTFEPGSVIKAFSIASALDSGLYHANSLIDTRPSWLVISGNTIKDERDLGVLSVTQVLKRSSNVGVTKMTLSLPAEQLLSVLDRVGFGNKTLSGFPGESPGVLDKRRYWRPFELATLAFGYGLSVTTVQLAKAYSVFANHGQLLPVSLIKLNQQAQAKQVLSKDIAQQIATMLEAVVEHNGTGRRARVKGYRVAGKTGTARIAGVNGYEKDHHVATFVGFAPVSHPRLVVAVVINDPTKGSYYGGRIAAPLFSKVMASSLRILDVAPDERQG